MYGIKVSIILPCYNVAEYILEIYENIKASTYSNYEIIFVNDGSDDKTAEIIKTLLDSRVILVEKQNGGVSSARNAGLEIAKGKYVLFVDPDDLIAPDMIEKAISRAESKKAELVLFGYKRVEIDNFNKYDNFYPKKPYEFNSVEQIIDGYMPSIIGVSKETICKWQSGGSLYWNKEWGAVWRALYRRDIIQKNKLRFNTQLFLNEDTIFNCHYLCCISSMTTINECLYEYRVKSNGAMYSAIRGDKLLKSKICLANEREEVRKHILRVTKREVVEWYSGSLVLSLLEIYVNMAQNTNFFDGYRMCKLYAERNDVKIAIDTIKIGRKIKFSIPLLLLKFNLNIFLYLTVYISTKIGIRVGI